MGETDVAPGMVFFAHVKLKYVNVAVSISGARPWLHTQNRPGSPGEPPLPRPHQPLMRASGEWGPHVRASKSSPGDSAVQERLKSTFGIMFYSRPLIIRGI